MKKLKVFRTDEKVWKCWEISTPKGDFLCTNMEHGGIYAVPVDRGLTLWELVRLAMAQEERNLSMKPIVDNELPPVIVDPNEILTGDMDR